MGSGEEGDSFVFLFENFSGVQTAQVGKKIVIWVSNLVKWLRSNIVGFLYSQLYWELKTTNENGKMDSQTQLGNLDQRSVWFLSFNELKKKKKIRREQVKEKL